MTAKAKHNATNSWREILEIHPAAELFPLMSETDPAGFKALVEDIKKHGLHNSVATWIDPHDGRRYLLDGRNRLDAMELVGIDVLDDLDGAASWEEGEGWTVVEGDPYAYVVSANIHRRHLTAEQRIEVAEKLAKANPTMSARRIAKLAAISPTTAVKARAKAAGDVSTVDTSISVDTKGRKQPAKKPRRTEDDFAEDLAAKCDRIATAMPGDIGPMLEDEPEGDPEDKPLTPREKKIDLENRVNFFLMNCAAVERVAENEYSGPIDDRVLEACRRTAEAWTDLADSLAAALPPELDEADDADKLEWRVTSAWQAATWGENHFNRLQAACGALLIKLREASGDDWDRRRQGIGISATQAERLIKKAKDWGADSDG